MRNLDSPWEDSKPDVLVRSLGSELFVSLIANHHLMLLFCVSVLCYLFLVLLSSSKRSWNTYQGSRERNARMTSLVSIGKKKTTQLFHQKYCIKARNDIRVYLHFEKPFFKRVPKERVWWNMEYLIVRILQYSVWGLLKYGRWRGSENRFDVRRGVRQGSVLCPLWFVPTFERILKFRWRGNWGNKVSVCKRYRNSEGNRFEH